MAWGGCVGLAAALLVVAGTAGAGTERGGGAPEPMGSADPGAEPGPGVVAAGPGKIKPCIETPAHRHRGSDTDGRVRGTAPHHPGAGDRPAGSRVVASAAGARPHRRTAGSDEPGAEVRGIAARIAAAPSGLSREAATALAAAIVREARVARLDPLLVAAVIEVESSFRPRAVSRAGALGLMQVMPATGAWLAAEAGRPDRGTPPHLLEPEWNVALGVRYLAHLLERFGRVEEALVAYNAGPNRARRILSGEQRTRWLDGYPRKVLALRDRLRAEVAASARSP
jgi:hypothetical protein